MIESNTPFAIQPDGPGGLPVQILNSHIKPTDSQILRKLHLENILLLLNFIFHHIYKKQYIELITILQYFSKKSSER